MVLEVAVFKFGGSRKMSISLQGAAGHGPVFVALLASRWDAHELRRFWPVSLRNSLQLSVQVRKRGDLVGQTEFRSTSWTIFRRLLKNEDV